MNQSIFYSTSAQILINHWTGLHRIAHIIFHGPMHPDTENHLDTKHQMDDEDEHLHSLIEHGVLLTEEKWLDAYHGPYHTCIRAVSHTYSAFGLMRMQWTISQDEQLKNQFNNTMQSLPDKKINAATLDKAQNILDTTSVQWFQKWEQALLNWKKMILQAMHKTDLTYSDLDQSQFFLNPSRSDLKNQFMDLQIASWIERIETFSAQEWIKCQCILCIRNILSRQMKPYASVDIESYLNQFKNEFKLIAKEEKKMNAQMYTEIHTLTSEFGADTASL